MCICIKCTKVSFKRELKRSCLLWRNPALQCHGAAETPVSVVRYFSLFLQFVTPDFSNCHVFLHFCSVHFGDVAVTDVQRELPYFLYYLEEGHIP